MTVELCRSKVTNPVLPDFDSSLLSIPTEEVTINILVKHPQSGETLQLVERYVKVEYVKVEYIDVRAIVSNQFIS